MVLLCEPRGDRLHFGGRLLQVVMAPEPPDHGQERSHPGRQDLLERPELFQRHPQCAAGLECGNRKVDGMTPTTA